MIGELIVEPLIERRVCVGVVAQTAQGVRLVRLQELSRPMISRTKLPRFREHTQNDLHIQGVLLLSRHFSVDSLLILGTSIQELLRFF